MLNKYFYGCYNLRNQVSLFLIMLKYLLSTLLLVPSISGATTWVTLNSFDKDKIRIIDKDSIVRKNGYVSYRMKDISTDNSMSIIYFKTDCINKKRTIEKIERYSDSSELLTTTVFHDIKFHQYPRNKQMIQLENIVCKNTYS
ncbi:hypothetical protein [Acinetobacter baumannii]|uniref:hypothetical protein n=1 Tax=Acinetobacter baumannii TaxID=470 RepID=UPI003892A02F